MSSFLIRAGRGGWALERLYQANSDDCLFPYFRNEFRESGSIYGNIGSRPSRFCPLESFKWFLRNLFPRRDDSGKCTQNSHRGRHRCSRRWMVARCCPREKCEEASSGPSVQRHPPSLASSRGQKWCSDSGKLNTIWVGKNGMSICMSLSLKIYYQQTRKDLVF